MSWTSRTFWHWDCSKCDWAFKTKSEEPPLTLLPFSLVKKNSLRLHQSLSSQQILTGCWSVSLRFSGIFLPPFLTKSFISSSMQSLWRRKSLVFRWSNQGDTPPSGHKNMQPPTQLWLQDGRSTTAPQKQSQQDQKNKSQSEKTRSDKRLKSDYNLISSCPMFYNLFITVRHENQNALSRTSSTKQETGVWKNKTMAKETADWER